MVEPTRPLKYPSKLLLASAKQLFIADTGHHRILEVKLADDNKSGEIVRVFGTSRPGQFSLNDTAIRFETTQEVRWGPPFKPPPEK